MSKLFTHVMHLAQGTYNCHIEILLRIVTIPLW